MIQVFNLKKRKGKKQKKQKKKQKNRRSCGLFFPLFLFDNDQKKQFHQKNRVKMSNSAMHSGWALPPRELP